MTRAPQHPNEWREVKRLYWLWHGMKQRCSNPRHHAYRNYGGRGITYDPKWASFENFLADMWPRPPGATLERIDNDGPYSEENCRWATRHEQARNKRTSRRIGGRCLTDWAEATGISFSTLSYRVRRHGNLHPPSAKLEKRVMWLGETKSMRAWAKDPRSRVSYEVLRDRVKRGWEFGAALTTPPKKLSNVRYQGKTAQQWAAELGVKPVTIYARLSRHGSPYPKGGAS